MRGEKAYARHLRRYHKAMWIATDSLSAMHAMIAKRCGDDAASHWRLGPLARGDHDPMPDSMPESLADAVNEVRKYAMEPDSAD